MLTLVNGITATTIPVSDRGLQYGDGLFETVAVRNGKVRLWHRHLQRLFDGCERLQLRKPDTDVLEHELSMAIQDEHHAVVKIIVTRGTTERGYRIDPAQMPTRIVRASPWPDFPDKYPTQGIALRWCRTMLSSQTLLAGLKHLNRLEQVLARAEWTDEFAEGLMCDYSGKVIEGTMSNLFLVRDGVLTTPDLSQCGVAGVMRAEVMERASRFGIDCRIQAVTPVNVSAADELFITNAVIGIWPVSSLETRHYAVGKVTQALQAALSDSD